MSALVQAAGGVLWRPDGADVAVAVVHRPRYDDWSLPKGKRRSGEHLVRTAVREVQEETGQRCRLGRPLGCSRYDVDVRGRRTPKEVTWWAVRATGGEPSPGDEVDEVRWVSPDDATRLLTQEHEVQVLDRFLAAPPEGPVVLLVRHARAGSSEDWAGDDALRPLDEVGVVQATGLAEVLGAFAPTRVLAAPPLRCISTVVPLAERLHLPVQVEPALGEQVPLPDAAARAAVVQRHAVGPASVLCSQGGFIPDAVAELTGDGGRTGPPPARKGSVWVLAFDGDRVLPARYIPDATTGLTGGEPSDDR